jgi:hypothetical protein
MYPPLMGIKEPGAGKVFLPGFPSFRFSSVGFAGFGMFLV